jgi:hypothetical protein
MYTHLLYDNLDGARSEESGFFFDIGFVSALLACFMLCLGLWKGREWDFRRFSDAGHADFSFRGFEGDFIFNFTGSFCHFIFVLDTDTFTPDVNCMYVCMCMLSSSYVCMYPFLLFILAYYPLMISSNMERLLVLLCSSFIQSSRLRVNWLRRQLRTTIRPY